MAEKVTISLEVDVSDLEELSKEGKEAGDEMESAFSKISKQAKNLFDQGAFDKISGQLLDLNEGFNNLLRQSIEPLTRQMGVFGGVLDFALERFIDFKDVLITGPIKAFSGSIAFATGTIKSLAQAVPVVGDSIKGLINQIPKLTSVFLALSTTVQGAIAGQLAVLPGILGAIGIAATGLATTLGRSLEDSFNRVAEIVAGTTVRMKELEQQLIEIGSTVPENLDQVAKTMRTITKAGIRSEKTIDDLTRTTVKLGRLADASFTQVGEQITNIATSFDLLGKNAGENVDAFANDIITVRNNTVAGVSEITTSLRRVASSASVLDIPIDQMLALTGAIQQAGQTARRSGTRLRRGFEEIVQTLSDVEGQRAFADLLNIDTSEFRSRIQSDVGSVIIDLANALGNSEENAKDFANTIDTLGTAGGTALTAVASKAGLLNELLGKMNDNTNALQKATETTLDRFSQQFSILTDKITLFFKTVGLAILDPFTNLVRNINKQLDQARSRVMAFARTIRENIPDIKDQISELFGFEGEGFTGFNLDALKEQVNTTFKEVGNAFGRIIVTVLKATFENVILPLGTVFAKNSIAVFKGFFSSDFGQIILNSLKRAFNSIINFIWQNVAPIFLDIADAFLDKIINGLASIEFNIEGPFGTSVPIDFSGLKEGKTRIEATVEALEQQSKLINQVTKGSNEELSKSGKKLNSTIKQLASIFPLLNKEQRKTAKSINQNMTNSLIALRKRSEATSDSIKINAIDSFNKRLSKFNKVVENDSIPALEKMSKEISDNFVETLFNRLDKGLLSDEQWNQIEKDLKKISGDLFGPQFLADVLAISPGQGRGQGQFPSNFRFPEGKDFQPSKESANKVKGFFDKTIKKAFEKARTFDLNKEQQNRIKQVGNDVVNAWANGIEAIIQGEEFNVVKTIADSFVTQFSNELASQMSKKLGAKRSAKKVAEFVTRSITFIFEAIEKVVKSQQVKNLINSIVGSLGFGNIFGAPAGDPSNLPTSTPGVAQARKGGLAEFAKGGSVSGQGGIDQIMAMLSRGEFVVRREAVNAQTLPFLQQLNNNKGFRQGGQVGSSSGQSDGLPNSGNKYEININAVDASSFQALVENNPEVITRQIEKNIEKNGSVRKMIQQKASK